MSSKQQKNVIFKWVFFLILLILAVINFLYWAGRKEIGYADEVYTYQSVNGFEQEWPRFIKDEWMSGEEIVSYLAADNDLMQFKSISDVLYGDHVPLYFWMTRFISLTFFKHQATMWVCLCSNLFFYLLFLSVVFLFFCKVTGKPWISFLMISISIIYNRTVLEQATMLRMYIMMLALMVCFLIVGLKVFRKAEEGKTAVWWLSVMTIVGLAGLLTHYDFWIFYALTSFCTCLYFLIRSVKSGGKKYFKTAYFKNIVGWVASFVISFGATVMLFPYCVWNLHKDKGWVALTAVADISKDRLGNILWGFEKLSKSFFGEIPTIVGVIVIFAVFVTSGCLLLKEKKGVEVTSLTLSILISVLYQMTVCFTLPDVREERYVWCTNTVLYLCFFYSLFVIFSFWFRKSIGKAGRQAVVCITGSILVIALVLAQRWEIDGGKGISYLEYESKDMEFISGSTNLDWVVYGPCEAHSFFDFIYARNICFMSNTESEADYEAARYLESADSFLIYAYPSQVADAEMFFEKALKDDLTFAYMTQSTNFDVYLVTRQ